MKENKTQIRRITRYEKIMDDITEKLNALEAALDGYTGIREEIGELENYYGSSLWKKDFESDEKGLLPCDLKRGILSEDGIYDLLERNRELMEKAKDL